MCCCYTKIAARVSWLVLKQSRDREKEGSPEIHTQAAAVRGVRQCFSTHVALPLADT